MKIVKKLIAAGIERPDKTRCISLPGADDLLAMKLAALEFRRGLVVVLRTNSLTLTPAGIWTSLGTNWFDFMTIGKLGTSARAGATDRKASSTPTGTT